MPINDQLKGGFEIGDRGMFRREREGAVAPEKWGIEPLNPKENIGRNE
jgi:hypothetical protein